MYQLLLMIFICYLTGSIPTAIITSKILKGVDIRTQGSGNAGATNVFRVLGWKAGVFVLLVDMVKGLIATILLYKIGLAAEILSVELLKIIAGLSAVFGHIWTIFARFKGGKGVGTGAGMILGILPGAVLAGLIVFVLVVAVSRYVSLGSILASVTIPLYLVIKHFVFGINVSNVYFIFGIFIPVLIIFTHRTNVTRLLNGNENKIQFKKT